MQETGFLPGVINSGIKGAEVVEQRQIPSLCATAPRSRERSQPVSLLVSNLLVQESQKDRRLSWCSGPGLDDTRFTVGFFFPGQESGVKVSNSVTFRACEFPAKRGFLPKNRVDLSLAKSESQKRRKERNSVTFWSSRGLIPVNSCSGPCRRSPDS